MHRIEHYRLYFTKSTKYTLFVKICQEAHCDAAEFDLGEEKEEKRRRVIAEKFCRTQDSTHLRYKRAALIYVDSRAISEREGAGPKTSEVMRVHGHALGRRCSLQVFAGM